jgi:hypothetical protein
MLSHALRLRLRELKQRGGAAVGDAARLLFAAEAEHRMERKRAAEPVRLDRHQLHVHEVRLDAAIHVRAFRDVSIDAP